MPLQEKGVAYFGEYKCAKCQSDWKSNKSFKNVGQECRHCKTMVMATKQRPLQKTKKVYKSENESHLNGIGPFFGEFNCRKCKKQWMSAYCWFEDDERTKIPQKCKSCNVNSFAIKMRPLEKSESKFTKPHKDELCGKCKKLGYSCELLKLAGWRI